MEMTPSIDVTVEQRKTTLSLLVDGLNLLIPSLAGGDELFRAGRPSERLRLVLVVQIDEVQNRALEILDGIVDAAPEPAPGQLPEEALDGVHPRAGGRREVEGPAAMLLQPVQDGFVLVGGVVVHSVNRHPKVTPVRGGFLGWPALRLPSDAVSKACAGPAFSIGGRNSMTAPNVGRRGIASDLRCARRSEFHGCRERLMFFG